MKRKTTVLMLWLMAVICAGVLCGSGCKSEVQSQEEVANVKEQIPLVKETLNKFRKNAAAYLKEYGFPRKAINPFGQRKKFLPDFSLTCNPFICFDNNFVYTGYCTSKECIFRIMHSSAEMDRSSRPDENTMDYVLLMRVSEKDPTRWRVRCSYKGPQNKKICKALKWTAKPIES